MSPLVSKNDYPHFKHVLQSRHGELRAAIHDALLRSDQEPYQQVAGLVHDAQDESIADLLVDVNLAAISREIQELRDVEAALRRLVMGTYGVCTGCGLWIARERLDAYPTAKRCVSCQRREERVRLAPPTPSL